jgi:hypothetical protein
MLQQRKGVSAVTYKVGFFCRINRYSWRRAAMMVATDAMPDRMFGSVQSVHSSLCKIHDKTNVISESLFEE